MARKGFRIEGVKSAVKFLKKEEKRFTDDTNKAIHNAGFFLEGEVKNSIAGRRAEPVSVDTGKFLQSVNTDNSKRMQSTVFSSAKYAVFLEKGTSRIPARRHFQNSAKRNEKKIANSIAKTLR